MEQLCAIREKEDAITEATKSWTLSRSETSDFLKYLAHDLKHPLLYRFVLLLFDANKVFISNISDLAEHYKGTFELKVLVDIIQWQFNFQSNLISRSVPWPRKNYYDDKNKLYEVIVRTYGFEEVWVHFLYMASKSEHRRADDQYSICRLMDDFFHSFNMNPPTPQTMYQLLIGKMYLLHYLLITFQSYNEVYEIFNEILSLYKELKLFLSNILIEKELNKFHFFYRNLLYRYYTRYGSTYQVYLLLKEMRLYSLTSREDIFYINLQYIGLTCLFQSIDEGLQECKTFYNNLKMAIDTNQIYSSLIVKQACKDLEQCCNLFITFPIEFATFIDDLSLKELLPVYHKIEIPSNDNNENNVIDYIFYDDVNQEIMKDWSFDKQWEYLKYRINFWAFIVQQPYRAFYIIKLMHDLLNIESEKRSKQQKVVSDILTTTTTKTTTKTTTTASTDEMTEKLNEFKALRTKVFFMPDFMKLIESIHEAPTNYFYCQFNSTYLYQHMIGVFYYGDEQPTWTRSDRMFELQLKSYIQGFTLYDIYYHHKQYEDQQQSLSSCSLLPLPKQYWKYFPEIFKRAQTNDRANYFNYHFLTLALKLCNDDNKCFSMEIMDKNEEMIEKHNLLAVVYYTMGSLKIGQYDMFNMNIVTIEFYWNKLFDLFLFYLIKFQTRNESLNQNKQQLDIPENIIVYLLEIFRSSQHQIVLQHPILYHKFFQLTQLLMKGMQNKGSSIVSTTVPIDSTNSSAIPFVFLQVSLTSATGGQYVDLIISNPIIWYELFANNFHPSPAWNSKDTIDKFLNDLINNFDEFYMKTYFFNKYYPEIIQSNQLLQEMMMKISEIQQRWISNEKNVVTAVMDDKGNWIHIKCNEYKLWDNYIQPYLLQQMNMILSLRLIQCHISEKYEETNIEFNCAYEILNLIRFIQLFSFTFFKDIFYNNLIEIINYYNIAISSIDRITNELKDIRKNVKDIRIYRNAYIMKLLFSMNFIADNPTIYEFCNLSPVSPTDGDMVVGRPNSSLLTNTSSITPSPSKEQRLEEVVTLAKSALSTISKIQRSGWSSDLIHLTTIVPCHRNDVNATESSSVVGNVSHICATPGCGKPANMICPTCLKLGIPPSRFCGQTCFESYWKLHKLSHTKVVKEKQLLQEKQSSLLPIDAILSIQRSTGGVMDCDQTALIYRCFEWLLPFQIYTHCNQLPEKKIQSETSIESNDNLTYWTKVDIHQPFSNDFYANGSLEYLESLFLAPLNTIKSSNSSPNLDNQQSSLQKLKYLHICGEYNWIHFNRFCNYLLLLSSPSTMTNGITTTTTSMICLHTLKIAYNRLVMNRTISIIRNECKSSSIDQSTYSYNTRELFCNAIKYNTSLDTLIVYVTQSDKSKVHSRLTIDTEFLDALSEALAYDISRIKTLTIDNVYLPNLDLKDYSITKFLIKPNHHINSDDYYQRWRQDNLLRYQLIQSKQCIPINSSLQYINYNMNYITQSTLLRDMELTSILNCLNLATSNIIFNWEDNSPIWMDQTNELFTMLQNRSVGIIKHIHLNQMKLQSYSIDLLSSQLFSSHCIKLQTIALTNNCLTLQQLATLIELWIDRQYMFPVLEVIDLHSCYSCDPLYSPIPSMFDEELLCKVMFSLSTAIQNYQFPALKRLNLASLHLQDIHVITLMSVLTESYHQQQEEKLSPCCCITSLNLSHNHLTSNSIASLSEWIRLSNNPIHELQLEGNIQLSINDSNRLISEGVLHSHWMKSHLFICSMHMYNYPFVALLVEVYRQLEEKFLDIALYDNDDIDSCDNNRCNIADYIYIPVDVTIHSMFGYYLEWWKVLYSFMNLKQQCQIQLLSLELLIDSMTGITELIEFIDYYLFIIDSQPIIDKNANCIKTVSNNDKITIKYQNILSIFTRMLQLSTRDKFYIVLDWILSKHKDIDGASSVLCETIIKKGIAAIGTKEENTRSWLSSHSNTSSSPARDTSVLPERLISEDEGLNILNYYLWHTTHKVNVAVQVMNRLDMEIKSIKANQSTLQNYQQRLQQFEDVRLQLVKNHWYNFLTIENHYHENQSLIELIVQEKLQEWHRLENEFILSRQQSRQSRGSEAIEGEGTLFNLPLEEALFAYLVIRYFIRVAPSAVTGSNSNVTTNSSSLSFRLLSSNNNNNTGSGNSFQRNEVLFLLNIPSIRGIVSKDLKDYKINYGENHLLRLAIESNKPEAIAVLLTVDTVRALAERNNYYARSNQRGVELRRLAADTESSMVSLTSGEESRLQRLMQYYAPIIDSMGGIMVVFKEFVKRLEDEYEAKPAVINVIDYDSPVSNTTTTSSNESYEDPGIRTDTLRIELPLKWSEYVEVWKPDLYPIEQQRALIAYHKHTIHTAWRYLQKPNNWIDTNAMYVETMSNDSTLHYSTFKQYIPLIVLFYVAAIDETLIGPEQYTPTQRYEHFLMELCYINRAHNWDVTRWNPITHENEEYDNILEGDRPSCYSGVKRRLFQSLLDHPLFIPLTLDVIYQELKDFLKVLFVNKLQQYKQQPWYPSSSPASLNVSDTTGAAPVVTKKTVLTVFDRIKQAWHEWIDDLNAQSLPILHQVNIEDIYPVMFQAFHSQMSQKYNESYLRDQTMTWKVQLFFMNLQNEPWKERDNKVHLIELSGFVDFQIIFNQLSFEEENDEATG